MKTSLCGVLVAMIFAVFLAGCEKADDFEFEERPYNKRVKLESNQCDLLKKSGSWAFFARSSRKEDLEVTISNYQRIGSKVRFLLLPVAPSLIKRDPATGYVKEWRAVEGYSLWFPAKKGTYPLVLSSAELMAFFECGENVSSSNWTMTPKWACVDWLKMTPKSVLVF